MHVHAASVCLKAAQTGTNALNLPTEYFLKWCAYGMAE